MPDKARAREEERRRIDALFARVFGTPDGLEVLSRLRAQTIERVCGPDVSERALAALEGQRQLVAVIERRVANGLEQNPDELRASLPPVRTARGFRSGDDGE